MNIMNRFTLQTLYKNKLRTLVTIIGIILSTAMFTGVTSIVTSLQQYLINLEITDVGKAALILYPRTKQKQFLRIKAFNREFL